MGGVRRRTADRDRSLHPRRRCGRHGPSDCGGLLSAGKWLRLDPWWLRIFRALGRRMRDGLGQGRDFFVGGSRHWHRNLKRTATKPGAQKGGALILPLLVSSEG